MGAMHPVSRLMHDCVRTRDSFPCYFFTLTTFHFPNINQNLYTQKAHLLVRFFKLFIFNLTLVQLRQQLVNVLVAPNFQQHISRRRIAAIAYHL